MYLIINSTGLIAEIAQNPSYVLRQPNGVVITCSKERGQAIYSNDSDTFYPLTKEGFVNDSYSLVEVETIPDEVVAGYYFYHNGEFYITEDNQLALEKAKATEQLVEENTQLKSQVASLEGELTNAQVALCDMYELIVGGDIND